MIKGRLSYKEGYLYKYDKKFKQIADEEVARIKQKQTQGRH